jgi:hypothetical protein
LHVFHCTLPSVEGSIHLARLSSVSLENLPRYQVDSCPGIGTMSSSSDRGDAIAYFIQAKFRFFGLVFGSEAGITMTNKQQQAWRELCLKAVQEPDPAKQMEIVAELNRMLQSRAKAPSTPLTHSLKLRPSR